MRANVLVVDDDPALLRALCQRMAHWGHAVTEAPDGERALAAVAEREYDLVLLDLGLPGISGLDVLARLKRDGCRADVVVLTAQGSVEAAVSALKAGASDFLEKPAEFSILQAAVHRALARRADHRVARALSDRLADTSPAGVVAAAPAMVALLETAARAAASNAVVLLTGESGSGKQVLAEFVHARSPRAAGPFVYLNCVALSDDLVESTLFGHEKGAFTGAVGRKEGRLELAAGGTAFLDEIGDVSPRVQAKLLHFLESGEFERVGSTRTLRVDCRVVAATNRDLPAAVASGAFREDLYYRLNVIRLGVPPLRERHEDVPLLVRAFLDRLGRELKRGPFTLARRTEEVLAAYAWPGNVRQLKNAVERMAVLAPGNVLTPDLLPPEVHGSGAAEPVPGGDLPLKDAVLAFKKGHVARALAKAGGSRTRAAEMLGLQRTFLSRLLRVWGMQGDAAASGTEETDEAEAAEDTDDAGV